MRKENITYSIPSLSLNIHEFIIDSSSKCRDMHFHNAIELVKVNSGKLFCRIYDEDIPLSTDNVILINSGVLHRLKAASPTNITYMQIDIDKYQEAQPLSDDGLIYEFIKSNKSNINYIVQKNNELRLIFESIKKEAAEKRPAYLTYIKSHIIALSGFMQRNSLLTASANVKGKEKLKELSPAISYINENYNRIESIEEIAAHFRRQ